MPIPASQIVSVNPRVIQAGGTDLVINGLLLTDNARIPMSAIALSFPTAVSVGEAFGLDSGEYAAAQIYFNGYDNSFKKPAALWVARRVASAAAAWMRGANYAGTLAELKQLPEGTITLNIDGAPVTSASITLSSATSLSDVASLVQAALAATLPGTTCTYDSVSGAFTVASPATGEESSIGYATGAIATLMNLTQATGATLSQGTAALSVAENMNAILQVTQNFVTFTNLYAASDAELVELAQWAGAQGVNYLFVCWSTDAVLLNQSDTTSIAYQLKQANATACTVVYGAVAYAAFIMGMAASIDFNRTQGAISFAFKQQDGLAATCETTAGAATLLSKKCNFYGNYATRNDQFIWLYNGSMYGDYNFIDPFINAIWLNNAIQLSVMNGLGMSPRVPYNDDGYSQIRAWIMDPINRAKKNGVIDAGVTLSEAQKAEVIREAGLDITSNLETDGYYLQVQDAGAHVRTTRDSPDVSLWYTYGGSVNKITMASTLIL